MNEVNTENEVEVTPAPEQTPPPTPVQEELERVRKAGDRTEKEKAAFTLKKNAERLVELGGDPDEVLGKRENVQDEVPQWFKNLETSKAKETALDLADGIEDVDERELVKHQLEHVITGGTPEERLKVARGYVNSVKSRQIAEELTRKGTPRSFSTGAGAPPRGEGEIFEPTEEEASMMASFGLTEADIKSARAQEAAKNQ